MPARTGAEFLGRLASTRTHVEIQGETLVGGVASHPAFANVVRTYAGLFDLQHDPEYRNILTYPSPDHRRPGGDLVPHSADGPGPGQAAAGVQCLGGAVPRHARPHRRLPEQRADGPGVGRRVVRPGRHRLPRNIRRVLREGPRGRPALHPHAHPAAGEPRRGRQPAGRRRPHGARGPRGRQRHRGPRRPDARDDRPVRRRAAGVPLDRAARHPGGQAVLVRVRGPGRRARAARSSPASPSTTAARTSTTRWAPGSTSRTRW